MKALIFTDVHWSETSSIINSQGSNYSTRLEHLIKSVSWAEEQADLNNCDQIICLGDFFDKPNLTSAELTALNEVKWSNKPHFFLVGNHESPRKSLIWNSVNALKKFGFEIISEPTQKEYTDCVLSYIPYCLEEDRKPLAEYLPDTRKNKIVLSHNDIKGIQYGAFTSKEGFDIEEIDRDCNCFLNGHLHNGERFSSKGYNLGNLLGQNFTEDAFNHAHNAFIFDTFSMALTPIENPYAFNFYKIEINNESDIKILETLKNNAVLSIKCNEKYVEKVRGIIEKFSSITSSRIIISRDIVDCDEIEVVELGKTDYLQQFATFTIDTFGKDEIVLAELAEVCK